jgi:methionyl-tRNA synthetase
VPANEYMNFGGQKASKSAGIGTTVPDLLKVFDPDPIRYYLTANAPENSDSDYSSDELIRRNNDELVAAWGNLVNRTLTFTQRYFEGKVPGDGTTDPALAAEIEKTFETVTNLLASARFKETIGEVMALARVGNRFFDEKAPWRQVKEDHAAAGQTIGSILNLINALKVLFAPFLPFTSAKLHDLLGYEDSLESHGWRLETLAPGTALPKPGPLFVKIDPSTFTGA